MSTYVAHTYKPGDILKAENLNRIEQGIVSNGPIVIFDWINVSVLQVPSLNFLENMTERNQLGFQAFLQNPNHGLVIGILDSGRNRVGHMNVTYTYMHNDKLYGRALNCDGSLSAFTIEQDGSVGYFYRISENEGSEPT